MKLRKINNNFTLITVPNKKLKFNKSIFLGEWCIRNSAKTSKVKIISHHWNNIKKRNNDYKYLKKNYERILNILVNPNLNIIKPTNPTNLCRFLNSISEYSL